MQCKKRVIDQSQFVKMYLTLAIFVFNLSKPEFFLIKIRFFIKNKTEIIEITQNWITIRNSRSKYLQIYKKIFMSSVLNTFQSHSNILYKSIYF